MTFYCSVKFRSYISNDILVNVCADVQTDTSAAFTIYIVTIKLPNINIYTIHVPYLYFIVYAVNIITVVSYNMYVLYYLELMY